MHVMSLQVTVYGDDGLFGGSQCFDLTTLQSTNETVRGEVVTPIISVSEDVATNDDEVTITYSQLPPALSGGDRYVCARWNSSVNCGGGGWTVKDCSLVMTPAGSYQCKCLHQGTFTLLDVSRNRNPCTQAPPTTKCFLKM